MFYTRSPGQILSYLCRTLFLLHRVLLGSALMGLHLTTYTYHIPPTYRAVCYFYIKFWWYFIYMIISSTFPPPLTHTYSCFEFWWLYKLDYIYHSNPPPQKKIPSVYNFCVKTCYHKTINNTNLQVKTSYHRRSISEMSQLKRCILNQKSKYLCNLSILINLYEKFKKSVL